VTLKSDAYLKRLNNPSAWTQKVMPQVHNITRSLCKVVASFGSGIGDTVATIRLAPQERKEDELRGWLVNGVLQGFAMRPGISGAHLPEALKQTGQPQTNEQRLRGSNDQEADWVLVLDGYDRRAVESILGKDLHPKQLVAHGGAPGALTDTYRHNFALSRRDLTR
jgi:hypothetical protein